MKWQKSTERVHDDDKRVRESMKIFVMQYAGRNFNCNNSVIIVIIQLKNIAFLDTIPLNSRTRDNNTK